MSSSNLNSSYAELISLVQQYVCEEYESESKLTISPKAFEQLKGYSIKPKSATIPQVEKKIIPPQTVVKPPAPAAVPPPPAIEAAAAEVIEEKQEKTVITTPNTKDPQEFLSLFTTHFPNYLLQKEPPQPLKPAKAAKSLSPVIILSFYDDAPSQQFLKKLAEAIEKRFIPTSIFSAYRIESENKWESLLKSTQLKLILAPLHKVKELTRLKDYLEEMPAQPIYKLKEIPCLSLLDPVQYQKDNSRKTLLWNAICHQLRDI